MEQDKINEYLQLSKDLAQCADDKISIAYWGSRHASQAIAELVSEVQRLQEENEKLPDVVSELAIGDEVSSMIDYMEVRRGMVGKVVGLKPKAEYPVEVQFEGIKFLYLKNGVVGFKRDELGKVSK
jgi:hypothetical protein